MQLRKCSMYFAKIVTKYNTTNSENILVDTKKIYSHTGNNLLISQVISTK